MAAWAVVSTLTAITHNYTGLLLCRFFLGVAEAPFWPGCLYLLNVRFSLHIINDQPEPKADSPNVTDLLHQKGGCNKSCNTFFCEHLWNSLRRSDRDRYFQDEWDR